MKNIDRLKSLIVEHIKKMPAEDFADFAVLFISEGNEIPYARMDYLAIDGISHATTICKVCRERCKNMGIIPPCEREDGTEDDPCLCDIEEYLNMEA